MRKDILIKGAREHNLKNITVSIPRNKLTVITGLSGSGKSSLAFDTLYAEGQRRYLESLSSYARQFLGQMHKPDVDLIDGLSPSISIEQKSVSHNPRSTVGTITEIYDYMRILFARVGVVHCPECKRPVKRQSATEIIDEVFSKLKDEAIKIYSPIVRGKKGEYRDTIENIRKKGYSNIRIDNNIYSLETDDIPKLNKNIKHSIDILIDHLRVNKRSENRLRDSIETALKESEGLIIIETSDNQSLLYSEHHSCARCGISVEKPTPRMFSFNSPYGACPRCNGLGYRLIVDPELLIADPRRSIFDGAFNLFKLTPYSWTGSMIESVARVYNFDPYLPWEKLPGYARKVILFGSGHKEITFKFSGPEFQGTLRRPFEGFIKTIERRFKETRSQNMRDEYQKYMRRDKCDECNGTRLKKESLHIWIDNKSIAELSSYTIEKLSNFFQKLELKGANKVIAKPLVREIDKRLNFLKDVGLDYLTLDRRADTLAGGEAQRIRLATQIGAALMGVLYILDEPSIGLHQRDHRRLLKTLQTLREIGNTVVVIEHDAATMEAADYIIDLGPGAGKSGGYLVAAGNKNDIKKEKRSYTGQYLKGSLKIDLPAKRRPLGNRRLELFGATLNNLKDVNISIPVGCFVCVSGVSGSGKSSLINDTLYPAVVSHLKRIPRPAKFYKKIKGVHHFDKVINIDQSPIGRTPRSNPATYTKVFDPIRLLFSQLPDSRMRGYTPGRFSFNVRGGRCEHCEGAGTLRIEMHFLPDVYIPCEVCKGARYNKETLEITFKGRNIQDVLEMTVDEALEFFEHHPLIKRKLKTLKDVGLGYIHLGQSSTTLSGGEAQRIKLALELSRVATGNTLYILDEPTTGLHLYDIKFLMNVLNELVDRGNTVIVIEHHLDVLKLADYIIDLGPEGGEKGGRIIAEGRPEELVQSKVSYTGRFLKEYLLKK